MSESNEKLQTKQPQNLSSNNSGLRNMFNLNQAINHVKHVMALNSGENLSSPRSVLEQRALSGLAIALEDKKKPWPRGSDELRRRAVLESGSSKHMEVNTTKRRGNGGPMVDSSASNSYGSLPQSQNSSGGYWSDETMTTNSRSRSSSSLGNSIFYYGEDDHLSPCVHDMGDEYPSSPCMKAEDEDFLKCCFYCKLSLSMGKDIFMYRGDRAFCSAECRYQQIVIDECNGSSS